MNFFKKIRVIIPIFMFFITLSSCFYLKYDYNKTINIFVEDLKKKYPTVEVNKDKLIKISGKKNNYLLKNLISSNIKIKELFIGNNNFILNCIPEGKSLKTIIKNK